MAERISTRLNALTSTVLSLFRIVFGLLFALHGTTLLFGWPAGPRVPVGQLSWWAGLLELVLGALITVGLFTRIAAFIASGEMAVAFFTQHFPKGFWPTVNGGELSVLYCWAFFLLVFTGSGWLALDAILRRSRRKRVGKGADAQGAPATSPAET
ncbi:MAG TPA: DoxX family protein [Mycobacterium sp.]|nr:DoxX family protein [Mycobacterium sp.]